NVDDRGGLMSALLAEHERTLAALGDRTVALEEADGDAARALDARVACTTEEVDDLAGRLDSLADALSVAAGDASGTKDEVLALRPYVAEQGAHLGSRLMEQERSLAALDDRTGALEQPAEDEAVRDLDERLSTTNDRIEELATKVAAADQGHAEATS